MLWLLLLIWNTEHICSAHPIPLVAFSTRHREPQEWLPYSLSSLLLASQGYEELPQIHLMIGDTDSHYVDNLKHHKNIFIHSLTTQESKWWNFKPRKRGNWKGGFNYVRCLNITQISASSPLYLAPFDGVLIAEDDIIFTNDFWIKFQQLRQVIESDFPNQKDYMIDCYHRFSNGGRPSTPGKPYRLYKGHFCCTQLMFFTSGAAKKVGIFIQKELAKTDRLGYDISIHHASQQLKIPIYGALPALAQHIGVHSSIGSRGFHITDQARFEKQDTPEIHYQRTNQALHYGPILTDQLLQKRSHLTEQLKRHKKILENLGKLNSQDL